MFDHVSVARTVTLHDATVFKVLPGTSEGVKGPSHVAASLAALC